MEEGMAFTIEPIVMMCDPGDHLMMGSDKFSIVSPGVPSSQWEHIVLITANGCEVLTKRSGELF
jgi:methionyl aminopeptidase